MTDYRTFLKNVSYKTTGQTVTPEEKLGSDYVPTPSIWTGCYVATAVYGSYDCPQVWILRRYRDGVLGKSRWGRLFIRCYYAVSPTLVKCFGKTRWFYSLCKRPLDRLVQKLNRRGITDTPYNDPSY